MSRSLYLSRTGMAEPLGQSQVLGYLAGLSDAYAIRLISFERPDTPSAGLAHSAAFCARHGIRWQRLRYRNRPRVAAGAANLALLALASRAAVRQGDLRLIHARSYIPAAAAWAAGRLCGVPWIFDMRSLWPEELITAGRLRRGSWLHRLLHRAEARLLRDAAAVVSLTHAGAAYLQQAHPGALDPARLSIIPTCTDLTRFTPRSPGPRQGVLIGCHGSLCNGWFRPDLLARMFDALARHIPNARFEILSREDPALIRARLQAALPDPAPAWLNRLTIAALDHDQIPDRLRQQDLSVFFYAGGQVSELGRSPTRLGEALGCGVPVITAPGVGDVGRILQGSGCGHLLGGDAAADFDRAALAARDLLADPATPARCRRLAEAHFDLNRGIAAYRAIYHRLAPADPGPVHHGG